MSSGQGRRWERAERTVSEMWERKRRKAGVEIGAEEDESGFVVLLWGFVIGRTAGEAILD